MLTSPDIYQWQIAARHIGEVVVFVVIADVERDTVKWAVVRVRLVSFLEDVVLRDEVASHRVQPHGEERATAEIEQRP